MFNSGQQIEANNLGEKQTRSRIEVQTVGVQEMVGRVQSAQARILRHARSLGYFQDPPASAQVKPTAVSMTMTDALGDLDRALDDLSGSLNVFD